MTEITGRAMGMVAACPDLGVLELAPLAPEIHAHVEVCDTCQLVFELLEVGDAIDTIAACERFEPLIAARADGTIGSAAENLLSRHLASCGECRVLAETLAPSGDRETDLAALPQVAPAHYALGVEVGRGGMGRVLAARDLRVGRPVAVKELLGRSRQLAARFEREARITARLQHPGIVPIYEIGRWPDGTPFYSMRMVGGGTLREEIAAARTLGERLALLPALIAATEAVAFAHSQRIIHRDLTPSNVLVGAYGETVVIDWGLAKDLSAGREDEPDAGPHRSSDSALTNAGAVVGTAAYMPPEQANAGIVDERADVYALGAILYHVLAGAPPYRGDAGIDAVKSAAPKRIDLVAPAAPRDLISIVAKAMARDPQRRYPSARGLAEELKRYQAGRMVEAHEYTTRERMRRFIKRNRAPLVVTAVATLLFSLLGVIAVRRVLRESSTAKHTVLALLEEEGRTELLNGNSQRALAYFNAASSPEDDSPALRFMRATAMRELLSYVRQLECGSVVRDLSFSPDHTLLIASCHDVARAWRLPDLQEVAPFGPVPKGFDHVEFSHDGTRLVTYGGDGVARIWDLRTHALVQSFTHALGSAITFATFTPDDMRLATTGYDGYARIWDVATGTQLRSFRGSNAILLPALYGVLDTKGKRLLTFTIEGIGAGWDTASGTQIGSVEHGGFALGGAVAPAGDIAATCGLNHLVKLWDTAQPRLIRTLSGATDAVISCKFDGDGRRVLGTTRDGHAYVWDVATGATVSSVTHGNTVVWTGHFSHDGRRFLTVGITGTVKVWDTESGGLLSTHETQGGHEAAFSPDDQMLFASRGDGRIRIWRDPGGPQLASYPNEHVIAHSDDGARVVESNGFGALVLRDTASGAIIATAPIGEPVAFRDQWLAATTLAGHVVVIDATNGVTHSELVTSQRPDDIALATPDRIVVGYERGGLELWDHGTRFALGDRRRAVLDATGARALTFDGGAPQLWDTASRTLVRDFPTAGMYAPIGFAGESVVIAEGDEGAYTIGIWDRDGAKTTIGDVAKKPTLDPSGRFLTWILDDHTIKTRDLVDRRRPDTSFVGELLQAAQADPTGALLTGVAQLGTSVVVIRADDGRVLARWPISYAPATLSESSGMVKAPPGTAEWSRDGSTIISRSSRLERWNAWTDIERGIRTSPEWVSMTIHSKVPWRVVGSRLVRSVMTWSATLLDRNEPLINQKLTLVFRKPADLSSSSTWNATEFQNKEYSITTDETGHVVRDGLQPGTYSIVRGDQRYLLEIDADDGERTVDLSDLDH